MRKKLSEDQNSCSLDSKDSIHSRRDKMETDPHLKRTFGLLKSKGALLDIHDNLIVDLFMLQEGHCIYLLDHTALVISNINLYNKLGPF